MAETMSPKGPAKRGALVGLYAGRPFAAAATARRRWRCSPWVHGLIYLLMRLEDFSSRHYRSRYSAVSDPLWTPAVDIVLAR
ncbi:MAG TPA: hypothetical protein VG248_02975 [Caulobacteraceae bacterium]|nr:hypothetical protein [Caulobacteraceae bacterium]